MRANRLLLLMFAAVLAGCYHATIETGAKPSTLTVEKHWASGWVFGLVPPSTVETAAKCPNGVAKIETQLSFANMLVSFLTLNIYTPMDIRVTCAETAPAGTALLVPTEPTATALRASLEAAAEESRAAHAPVYVQIVH